MPSQLTTSPEETRAALVRHVTEKCGADAVANLLPQLDTTSIAQCLRVSPGETLEALRRRARLASSTVEAKVATHDGRVWPLPRERMADPDAIISRMAEDIARAARAQHDGVVEAHHLQAMGWTNAHIAAHGKVAARRAADRVTLDEAA